MRRSDGFTLIELMMVVVVIAILAGLAVVAYTRSVVKARSAEVPQIFGELKSREESYKAEFGTYASLCPSAPANVVPSDCAEGDYWPTPLPGKGNQMDATVMPARWLTLRVSLPRGGLYCQYEVIAGPAGSNLQISTMGQKLDLFTKGMWQFRAWYYLIAQCDWDGDPAVNALYWQQDDLTELGVSDPQR